MVDAIKLLPGSAAFAKRLADAIPHLDRAADALRGDRSNDDGQARSLFNDLQYLQARIAERLRVENEKLEAERS